MAPLRTDDGLQLHLRHWPATGRCRGTVQLVHGLGEHLGRHETLARELAGAGWDVGGHDLRGHGRSDGPRGDVPDGPALLRDIAAVMAWLRGGADGRGGVGSAAAAAHRPFVLVGHSLGGLLAARFVAEGLAPTPAPWWRAVDGLVLSSPALDLGLSRAQSLLLAVAAPLAPHARLGNGLKPEWISRDAAVVQAYVDDPLVHDRVAPALVRWMRDAGAEVRAQAARWRTPTLLMWAGADRCVAPRGSAAFAAAAAATGCVAAQPWPALAHEIFNEPERAPVVRRLRHWLDALAPVPSPSPETLTT